MEEKKRMNPWVPAVVMGVIAILFSFYALQSQSELQEARTEIERLNGQEAACRKAAQEQQARAMEAMSIAEESRRLAKQAEEDCKKSIRKK